MRASNRVKNGLVAAGLLPDHVSFGQGLARVAHVQRSRLLACLKKNRNTLFGREHAFAAISTIEQYRKNVPVTDYESVRPYIDRIAAGHRKILTDEDVRVLEPTGGTTAGSKLIPCTASLKREFQRAVNPWIFDLYRRIPGLFSTKSYWSVSPVVSEKRHTAGGIPVGFEDDSDYLGLLGKALKTVFAVPSDVRHLRSPDNFRYVTAYFLLSAQDLGLISVWNPTFLVLLTDYIESHHEKLTRDIHDGRLRYPIADGDGLRGAAPRPSPVRAREIEDAFRGPMRERYREIWRDLRVISCWMDGPSCLYAERITTLFPGVHVQPKGLLATEGIVSFPLEKAEGCVAAYNSHFMEFFSEDGGEPKLLHELNRGGTYQVVLTTGGGLYRYDLKDRIQVTGAYRGLPIFKFLARDHVSDLVGEKLEAGHVQAVVEKALGRHETVLDFVLFAPEMHGSGGYYALFVEPRAPLLPATGQSLAREIDEALKENFQYRYARELGQLGAPEVLVLNPGSGMKGFVERGTESGQRLGDIKQTLLDRRPGWKRRFSISAAMKAGPDPTREPGAR